jgi:hypothetical protein
MGLVSGITDVEREVRQKVKGEKTLVTKTSRNGKREFTAEAPFAFAQSRLRVRSRKNYEPRIFADGHRLAKTHTSCEPLV